MSTGVGQPWQATRPSGAGVTALPEVFGARTTYSVQSRFDYLVLVKFYRVIGEPSRVIEVVGVTGRAEYIHDPGVDFDAGIIQ